MNKKTILIVDDTFENLYFLRVILQEAGFDVIEATDGSEGLKKLHENSLVDLIISDILMPVMDGYMFCQACKKEKQFRHIPFIFYTSTYTEKLDEDFALKLGANHFLRKPTEPDVILQLVQELLTENRSEPARKNQFTEHEVLTLYSKRLISKLEQKNLDLENEVFERKKAETAAISANKQLVIANKELNALRNQLEQENVYLKNELDLAFNYEDMVYGSAVFSNVLTEVEKVAPTTATVMLFGESGTGKELLARAIHNIGLRNDKPLIKVNCSAIPKELIESEFFGHKKGSFTGAYSDKIGKFELADGGTLFLDEIGEMPLDMQPKILRFLQEGEIEVVGGTELRKLNVRVIAATNKNLKEEIENKRFREDLYFRLNVFPIKVPPLRERQDDIPLLLEHFIDKFNKSYGKSIKYIADEAMSKLKVYAWPGNIRELENLIERAVILSNDETLVIPGFESQAQKTKLPIINKDLSLDTVQRNHILQVLEQCNWKISGQDSASTLLKLKPSTLRDKMAKLGIKK
ncbi:sigma-54 dependent transcriptional regulator [uncultured Kriegella sp.]|uniref:sigma-54-dependent transcriptional regulator n=1 Tax=uncultured Kriegella sp. TaxID=1798910 RepID=UPI0030DD9350|tara:strand:- start:180843 stop:182408 length:1566 start_codon:yes stop_codon:yes gene_type:complete